MDEFVERRLKNLGKDYFLTEFDVVNPTNAPVTFDLFNSNTLTNVPTTLTFTQTPTTTTNSYFSVASTFLRYAINTQNNTLYVVDGGNTVTVIDNTTQAVITTINIGVPSGVNDVIYNPINNRIYAANAFTNTFDIIDCNTNTVISSIPIIDNFNFLQTKSFAYDISTNIIYYTVFNGLVYFVQSFDCNTNTPLNLNPPIITNNVIQNFIVFSPTNNFLYFARTTANLSGYDISLNSFTIVPIASPAINGDCIFNTQNGLLYVGQSFLGVSRMDIVNPITNTSINSILLPTIGGIDSMAYNSFANVASIADDVNNKIADYKCDTNTIEVEVPQNNPPRELAYNPVLNSNVFFTFSGGISSLFSVLPTPIPYISWTSYTYNQFNQDKKYQPFLLNCMLMYSVTPKNLNQVFDATVKDANGQIAKDPKFPALQISMYQFQPSVAKVCFGKKNGRGGFILDEESYFSNFIVQPNSTITLVLIVKQLKLGKNFTKPITLCEKLDPSVNPKLKIVTTKNLPKGKSKIKTKLKDKKPLAIKPVKSFFQEICSRMDGEQEVLQNVVNKTMSNFASNKNDDKKVDEIQDNKLNLGVPLIILGGVVIAYATLKK
jgi:YVTN family beta-propeller protein